MSQQAEALAERLEQAIAEAAAEIEAIPDAAWLATTPEDGRTVAALARHIAWGVAFESEAIAAIAEERPGATITMADLVEINAEHAVEYADGDQAETVDLLRRNGAAAVAIVRRLTDQQLSRQGVWIEDLGSGAVTEWIEFILIRHPSSHLPAIRAAVEAC